ncbi:hypothetical protein Tco_0670318 [Tanacetum coccineum]
MASMGGITILDILQAEMLNVADALKITEDTNGKERQTALVIKKEVEKEVDDAEKKVCFMIVRGRGEGYEAKIDTQELRNLVDSDTTLSPHSTDANMDLDNDDSEGEVD